ncbi:MAG: ABC transporter permease [Caldilineaceae bacterium]
MLEYITRRILLTIPTLIAVSIFSFFIIQLPPGDYLTTYVAQLRAQGDVVDVQELRALEERYGLNRPFHVQYWKWISGVFQGDFGYSFEWKTPVRALIWERLALTLVLSLSTLLFTWLLAIPIGVLSAVRQYSWLDYFATFFGFLGLGIPNFMLALVLMWISFAYFDNSVGGLFSPDFVDAPWSLARVWDMLKHLWIPMVVLGTSGTAGLIRIVRANMLDELNKPYVETARAKGLPEGKLVRKYPLRVALNPFISTIGYALPSLISGATITAVVLSLPTTGPLLLRSLQSQDMYLAGSFVLLLSSLTIIGTLLSDILLAVVDPRIRYNK